MNANETLANLTDAGKGFMALVGLHHFDFFDDGIVASSGNYGKNMAGQACGPLGLDRKSISGVMARLASDDLGLWNVYDEDNDTWWSLTALGAEVALLAAAEK
jgi:hypothetical protein